MGPFRPGWGLVAVLAVFVVLAVLVLLVFAVLVLLVLVVLAILALLILALVLVLVAHGLYPLSFDSLRTHRLGKHAFAPSRLLLWPKGKGLCGAGRKIQPKSAGF